MGVAEFAKIEQRLHHRLLQSLLSLRNRELVPVDASWVVLFVCSLQASRAFSMWVD